MDIKHGKYVLTSDDYNKHPIWKYNDEDDLYYPIYSPDDFPNNSEDLRIKAEFHTPSGIKLDGCIVGVKNFFSITIFVGSKKFYFNRNAPKESLTFLERLKDALSLSKNLKATDFFPMKFVTTINLANFKNISGEFDPFLRMTNEGRLK